MLNEFALGCSVTCPKYTIFIQSPCTTYGKIQTHTA